MMEVDSTSTKMMSSAASPKQAEESSEKASGDGEMDYEITMNDSDGEDDASSTGSAQDKSESKVLNGKPVSEDDESSSTTPTSKKATRSKTRSCILSATEGKEESIDGADDENSSDSKQSNTKTTGVDKPDREQSLAADKDDKNKKEDEDSPKTEESKNDKKSDSKEKKAKNKDQKETVKDKHKNKKEKSDKDAESELPVDRGEHNKSGKSVKKAIDDDDDVVMVDSPSKENVSLSNVGNTLVSMPVSSLGGISVASSMILDARAGVSVPYLTSMAGASLVPSGSGVQLVLPQGTAGVSGSAVMYLPTGPFASTSSMLLPTTAGSMPRNANPMLLSQYGGIGSGAPVRSILASQMANKNSPLAPVLNSMPDKPTSSKGMIDMIRWELENHINIKPKYVKPNPKAELGNLAKWHFDLGADLVKEYVYHDLVRIQLKRKDEGNLTAKEQDDFNKLQEIDKELNEKVGHLKIKLTKSCKCGFRTESDSVMYDHQLRPHIERGGFFHCALCKFSCRQPNGFRFHMEAEHGRTARMENKPSFYECSLCPYESNYTNRLEQHKTRCQRQFREAFNLHPSCMTGPEINLSLENTFYFVFTRQFMNSIVPPVPQSQANKQMVNAPRATNMSGAQGRMANTTLTSSGRQLTPRIPQNAMNKFAPNATNRNYPVISSQINVGANARNIIPQLPVNNRVPIAPNAAQPNSGFEVCEICGGYVKDRKALRIHFFYAHRIDMPFGVFDRPQAPLYCATCFARFWTAQGLQKHIEVHKTDINTTSNSNGVSGKCISCGHRVPNILLHMRMVHNRELRHYLAALMCIFCGQRSGSKQQVELHMNKVHGVIVKNSGAQGGGLNLTPIPPISAPPPPKPQAPVANKSLVLQGKGSKSGRSSQCVLCNLSFTRNVDLTRHCMRVHHTCMKCGLVVVDKESLSRHTCLHSASGMRTCQICQDTGFHPAYYIKHMRDRHLQKCSVVLRRIDRAVVETLKRPITISDSEDDDVCETQPAKKAKVDGGDMDVEVIDDEELGNKDAGEKGDGKDREKKIGHITDELKSENEHTDDDTKAKEGSSKDHHEREGDKVSSEKKVTDKSQEEKSDKEKLDFKRESSDEIENKSKSTSDGKDTDMDTNETEGVKDDGKKTEAVIKVELEAMDTNETEGVKDDDKKTEELIKIKLEAMDANETDGVKADGKKTEAVVKVELEGMDTNETEGVKNKDDKEVIKDKLEPSALQPRIPSKKTARKSIQRSSNRNGAALKQE